MDTNYFLYTDIAKDKCTQALKKAEHYRMEKIAQTSGLQTAGLRYPRSKMLVKLAGIMIAMGEKLQSYAEKDITASLPPTSLQDF